MNEELKEKSIEYEMLYLGALLLEIGNGKEVDPKASKADFHKMEFGMIYEKILDLLAEGKKPTVFVLQHELPQLRVPIALIDNAIPSGVNLVLLEEGVIKHSALRKINQAMENIPKQIAEGVNPNDILNNLSYIAETTQTRKISNYTSENYCRDIRNYSPENEFKLDIIRGITFPDGSLSYIGARPGGGKTIALINIAREALKPENNKKRKVVLLNLEMPLKAIATYYILSCMYDMASPVVRREVLDKVENTKTLFYSLLKGTGTADKSFVELQGQAIEKYEKDCNNGYLTIINGNQASTTTELVRYANRIIDEGTVVLIDYIQRMPIVNSSNNRYLEIKQISNAILQLAIQKNAVIISGAQLNRISGDKPTESSYRESGDIEQDAHNAINILANPNDKNEKCYAMKIVKAREGMSREYTVLNSTLKYMHMAGTDIVFKEPKEKGEKENGNGNGNNNGAIEKYKTAIPKNGILT